jgi:simple sugar transport system permease protein
VIVALSPTRGVDAGGCAVADAGFWQRLRCGRFGIELPGRTGLFIALGTAGLVGFFNGFMVVRVGLNPFISTLGLLVLWRGGVSIISNGRAIYSPGPALTYLGTAKLCGLPVSVLVFAVVAAVVGLVFKYHRFGRALRHRGH